MNDKFNENVIMPVVVGIICLIIYAVSVKIRKVTKHEYGNNFFVDYGVVAGTYLAPFIAVIWFGFALYNFITL